jgi:hypothetical protein
VPLNILDILDGRAVRNDNLTNFAYVGPDGSSDAPAVYVAYRPGSLTDATPIQPGETLQLKNLETGKFCRLAPLPAGLVSTSTCSTQGVICDQDSMDGAAVLTYTSSGLSYNGVPLVAAAPSNTLVLSADPACSTSSGGTQLIIVPAAPGGWH